MQPTTNEMTETQSDAMVGLDALEAGNLERARALLVGAGVTVEIGSTKLAGVIVKVTRCVITVTYGHGDKPRTFRKMPGAVASSERMGPAGPNPLLRGPIRDSLELAAIDFGNVDLDFTITGYACG